MTKNNHPNSKPEAQKLNRQLKVYVTREEEIDLKQEAEILGMSFSSYARAVLLEYDLHIDPVEQRRIRFEINKIGVNLNQLTRKANEKNDLPSLQLLENFRYQLMLALEDL